MLRPLLIAVITAASTYAPLGCIGDSRRTKVTTQASTATTGPSGSALSGSERFSVVVNERLGQLRFVVPGAAGSELRPIPSGVGVPGGGGYFVYDESINSAAITMAELLHTWWIMISPGHDSGWPQEQPVTEEQFSSQAGVSGVVKVYPFSLADGEAAVRPLREPRKQSYLFMFQITQADQDVTLTMIGPVEDSVAAASVAKAIAQSLEWGE